MQDGAVADGKRQRAERSRQEQTRADKSRQEQTRADKSRQEHTKECTCRMAL
jgi:hypothetical protein